MLVLLSVRFAKFFMYQPLSPRKAASLGILLIAISLIVQAIYNVPRLVYEFQGLPKIDPDITLTYVPICLIILWYMSPLVIGLILFRQHRFLVRWFYGYAVLDEKRSSWHDTGLVATLVIGLLGLFLLSLAVERFCNERMVLLLILEIDNPKWKAMWDNPSLSTRLAMFQETLYLFVFATVFIGGAGYFGKLIGRKIDQSLEKPLQEEDASR